MCITVNAADIQKSHDVIKDLFKTQCSEGQQTKDLGKESIAACGMFIGIEARSFKQRGIHGTAAAINVLANSGFPELTKLIDYAFQRKEIEAKTKLKHKVELDSQNIIKLSELLIAVAKIKSAKELTSPHIDTLAKQIQSAKCQKGCGWGYFVEDSEASPLPTAFAYSALCAAGFRDKAAEEYLIEFIKKRPSPDEIEYQGILQITCLYHLHFSEQTSPFLIDGEKPDISTHEKKRLFVRIATILSLEKPTEQNIEYLYKDQATAYVRVPWQLYLLALSSSLDAKKTFSSYMYQARLVQIVSDIREKRFRYPDSGKYLSARTHQIADECLERIERVANLSLYRIFKICMQKSWRWISTGWPRFITRCVVSILVILALFYLYQNNLLDWNSLDVTGTVIGISIPVIIKLIFLK